MAVDLLTDYQSAERIYLTRSNKELNLTELFKDKSPAEVSKTISEMMETYYGTKKEEEVRFTVFSPGYDGGEMVYAVFHSLETDKEFNIRQKALAFAREKREKDTKKAQKQRDDTAKRMIKNDELSAEAQVAIYQELKKKLEGKN